MDPTPHTKIHGDVAGQVSPPPLRKNSSNATALTHENLLLLLENQQVCEIQVIIPIALLKSHIIIGPQTREQLIIAYIIGQMSFAAARRDTVDPQ